MKRFALLSLTLALCACHSNVRDSSPSLLKDGIQLKPNTVAVDADHAKVVMKAEGGTSPVEFSVQRAGDADQRPEVLGTVVDTGRGKVFNWIAKLNEVASSATLKRFPQLETLADPDQKLTVSGYSSNNYHGLYSCGPLRSSFSPERGKVYLVEFQFKDSRCEQHVYDISVPSKRLPVPGTDGSAQSI